MEKDEIKRLKFISDLATLIQYLSKKDEQGYDYEIDYIAGKCESLFWKYTEK